MPNRYSHAFVLSDYERRGVFDFIYRTDIYRYHQPKHLCRLSSSSLAPSSTRSSVSYSVETSGISVQKSAAAKTSPPRPASSVVMQPEQQKQEPPQPITRPTPVSPSSMTPSSVVTQIYEPHRPRSYFDSDSPQTLRPIAFRPFPPSAEIYNPLSPLPTTLDFLDLDSSPGSEQTTPRSPVDGLTLDEMLLEAIPPSTVDRSTRLPSEESDDFSDEADDAVPPPISRHRRNTYSPKSSGHAPNLPRPSTPVSRPEIMLRTSFSAQTWSPPRPEKTKSGPVSPQPEPLSPRSARIPPKKPTARSQTYSDKHRKVQEDRPTPPPLQRTGTDLNAQELQRWKKDVQQAKWRRGSWVGALTGFKGSAGRREIRD